MKLAIRHINSSIAFLSPSKANFTFESLSSFEIETGKDVLFLVVNIQNMNNRKQRIIELFNMTVPNTPFDSTLSPFGTVICPFWYCQILDKAKKNRLQDPREVLQPQFNPA